MGQPRERGHATPKPITRRKRSVVLDDETWRRLGRIAIDLDVDRSALLEKWTRERLDRYERAGHDLAPLSIAPKLGIVTPDREPSPSAGQG